MDKNKTLDFIIASGIFLLAIFEFVSWRLLTSFISKTFTLKQASLIILSFITSSAFAVPIETLNRVFFKGSNDGIFIYPLPERCTSSIVYSFMNVPLLSEKGVKTST